MSKLPQPTTTNRPRLTTIPATIALGVVTGAAVLAILVAPSPGPAVPDLDASQAAIRSHLTADGAIPFVENRGQWDPATRFVADAGTMRAALHDRGMDLELPDGSRLDLRFANARATSIAGEGRRREVRHYLLGSDASAWRRDVPTWSSVVYDDVLPGIDVRVRDSDGTIEYDVVVEPGIDERDLRIESNAGSIRIDESGALRLCTERGELVQPAPRTFEETEDGRLREIPSRFTRIDATSYGFEVDGRDPARRLVIDPALVWSTFLGGRGEDNARSVVLLDDGTYAVTGATSSASFPNEGTATDEGNLFYSRYAADGQTLLSTTVFGGSGPEAATSMAVIPDGSGDVVIGGYTWSNDFPVTAGAFDTIKTDPVHACGYVARLSSDGSTIVFASFLGETPSDFVYAVAGAQNGEVIAAGTASSGLFPVTAGAAQTAPQGASDGFVTRFEADGTALVYSTLVGGTNGTGLAERVTAIELEPTGIVYVAGETPSVDFPVTASAAQGLYGGGASDAFLVRLSADGSAFTYGTFLGGDANDEPLGLARDLDGSVLVSGTTDSTNFPTTPGAFQTGGSATFGDGFVTRIAIDGSIGFSTLFVGNGDDRINDIAVDAHGNIKLAGQTLSTDFPVTPNAFQGQTGFGRYDGIIGRLEPDGGDLTYSSYFGGAAHNDGFFSLAQDPSGDLVLVGTTISSDFPLQAAIDTVRTQSEAIAVRFRVEGDVLLDIGPSGSGTPGTTLTIQASANSIGAPRPLDYWVEILLPDGTPYAGNPVKGPVVRTLPTGVQRTRTIPFRIPNDLNPGWHTLRVMSGTFPNTVDEIAGVRFEVL